MIKNHDLEFSFYQTHQNLKKNSQFRLDFADDISFILDLKTHRTMRAPADHF